VTYFIKVGSHYPSLDNGELNKGKMLISTRKKEKNEDEWIIQN